MKHAPVTFPTIAHFSISILGRSLFLDAANAHRNTSRPSRRPRLLRSTHASYARAANIRNDFGSLFSPFIFWVTLFRLFFLSPSLFLLYCDSHIPVTPMSVLSVAYDIINFYFCFFVVFLYYLYVLSATQSLLHLSFAARLNFYGSFGSRGSFGRENVCPGEHNVYVCKGITTRE